MSQTESADVKAILHQTTEVIGGVAADFKSAASEKLGAVMTEVKSQADDAKASVAGDVNDVATALRNASHSLRSGSAQERTIGQIANGLADASDALRDKDMGEIVQAVSKVARQNPVLFLGGAILLGFAATRYAKATDAMAKGKSMTPPTGRTVEDRFVANGDYRTGEPMGARS